MTPAIMICSIDLVKTLFYPSGQLHLEILRQEYFKLRHFGISEIVDHGFKRFDVIYNDYFTKGKEDVFHCYSPCGTITRIAGYTIMDDTMKR